MIGDWLDVGLHVLAAIVIAGVLALVLPWWAAALVNAAGWFAREAVQAKTAAWWLWSAQKRAEAFSPAVAGAVVAGVAA